jgi:predicted esterase
MRLIILSLLILVGCSKKESVPALQFDTSYTLYSPTIASNGKRVYLIHGSLKYSRAQWEHPVFKPFVDNLVASGYEVITFDLPHFYSDYFYDGGLNYRVGFQNQLRTIISNVETDHGVMDSIVGGFSFGGLHAMIAMSDISDIFQAYFAILPVVEISYLTELKGMASSHFRPINEVSILETKPGLISWGTLDNRVNYQYSKDLVNIMNPVTTTGIEYVGLDHTTSPEVVQDTIDWINNL